jgi:hypothetical protein
MRIESETVIPELVLNENLYHVGPLGLIRLLSEFAEVAVTCLMVVAVVTFQNLTVAVPVGTKTHTYPTAVVSVAVSLI